MGMFWLVKVKLTAAAILMSGSIVMLFAAAKVETCADKYKACTQTCQTELSKCKLSGRPDETCEQAHKICETKCHNAQVECENAQGGGKATAMPGKGKK